MRSLPVRRAKISPKILRSLLVATLLPLPMVSGAALDYSLPTATEKEIGFFGRCDDCVGTVGDGQYQDVTGLLKLQNFQADTAMDLSNFVSFSYSGSSILEPFTVTHSELSSSDAPMFSGTFTAAGSGHSWRLLPRVLGHAAQTRPSVHQRLLPSLRLLS